MGHVRDGHRQQLEAQALALPAGMDANTIQVPPRAAHGQNLIAGKLVVPELIQSDFTAAKIVQYLTPLIADGEPRQSMIEELARMRGLLHTGQRESGAIDRVAEITLEMIRS